MRNRIIKAQRTFVKTYPKNKRWQYDSPYWDYIFGKNNDKDSLISNEPLQANPDAISDDESIHSLLWGEFSTSEHVETFSKINWKKVLTNAQYKVLCKLFYFIKKGQMSRLNQDVAEALHMSHQGVANHINLIRKKMVKIFNED